MIFLESLSKSWLFFSLSAPRFVWLAALIILGFTIEEGIRLYLTVRRERKLYEILAQNLRRLIADTKQEPKGGLSEQGYEALRTELENRPELLPIWRNYLDELICERSTDGRDNYWSEGSAADAFAKTAGFGSRVNWKWFGAVPGFVTGVGLLVTFVAILFALADLHADSATGQIQGISQLLEGLAGKFISSVAALLCASFFLPYERWHLHRTEQSRQNLIDALDNFVPRLTPARILIGLKRDTAEQADALREMLTGLGPRLRQGLSESIGPTLERMVIAIEELNQLIRAAEAQRQDAVTSALKSTLDQLNEGLQKTLGSLGEGFSQTLVGEAGRSFDRVLASLEATGRLVERMNAQFEDNQGAIGALVDQARDSAGRQIELGRAHVEELSAVLRQLMERLNEATGSSVTQMSTALSDAITRMSAAGQESAERVAKLVGDLAAQVASGNGSMLDRTKDDLNLITDQVIGKIDQFSEQIARAVGRNEQATHTSVKKVLEETGSSVTQMNAALADGVRQMTTVGQESNDRLANLVSRLVAQVESSNGSVLARTKDDLNLITDQVIGKIDKFSEQIAEAVSRNAQATHASVSKVLEQTNELSRQNAERIASILDRNQGQLERTQGLAGDLNRLAEQFRAALPEYSSVTKALHAVAAETSEAARHSKDAATSIQQAAQALRLVQGQVSEVAKQSAAQIANIASTVSQTRESMTEYGRVFGQVKSQSAELLALIDERLTQQVAVSRDGYEAMSKAADEHFANAAKRLGGSIEGLTESLDTLEATIERLRTMTNGRAGR